MRQSGEGIAPVEEGREPVAFGLIQAVRQTQAVALAPDYSERDVGGTVTGFAERKGQLGLDAVVGLRVVALFTEHGLELPVRCGDVAVAVHFGDERAQVGIPLSGADHSAGTFQALPAGVDCPGYADARFTLR